MRSRIVKHSIVIAGHKTSVSLEDAFWNAIKDIAAARRMTLSDLVAAIDAARRHGNLSSAIRLFVLDHFQSTSNDRADRRQSEDAPAPPKMMAAPTAATVGRDY